MSQYVTVCHNMPATAESWNTTVVCVVRHSIMRAVAVSVLHNITRFAVCAGYNMSQYVTVCHNMSQYAPIWQILLNQEQRLVREF